MSAFLSTHTRTHSCGALRADDVGKQVVLTGWVQSYRDHGGCVFIDLRDREGITQLVFDPSRSTRRPRGRRRAALEWCIGVAGEVALARRQGQRQARRPARSRSGSKPLEVFSKSETPPFPIEDDIDTNEALRLKYRYLDLRRPELQKNLIMRSNDHAHHA